MTNAYVENQTCSEGQLEFLWLELTNRCNLQCVHCYAESGPYADDSNQLSVEEYEHLIQEAFDLGCRKVQFIGGEPTLNRTSASSSHPHPSLVMNLSRFSVT